MHAPIDTNDTYIYFEKHILFVLKKSDSISKENHFVFSTTSTLTLHYILITNW